MLYLTREVVLCVNKILVSNNNRTKLLHFNVIYYFLFKELLIQDSELSAKVKINYKKINKTI